VTRALAWLGARASQALVVGIALCFVIPEASALLRPALPYLVPIVLGLAMARVDLRETAHTARVPGTLLRHLGLAIALMPVSAAAYLGIARAVGLDPGLSDALVYLAAAPPIASATALCFIMGYNARLALEATIAATLLTPLLGPLTVVLFLNGTQDLAPLALAAKLAAMIFGACAVALAIRRLAGPARLARGAAVMDGIGVIALVVFVIPLFDGVPGLILGGPVAALEVLVVACLANLGVNFLIAGGLGRVVPQPDAGAFGIVFGNRTIAMYLAVLPFDPRFSLFVALYQVPMLLTPMLMRTVARRR
jgi:predicted Na+-dependent transporter